MSGCNVKIRRIWFRCEHTNPWGVPCSHDATHEVLCNGEQLGRYCAVHADMKERDHLHANGEIRDNGILLGGTIDGRIT